MRVLFASIAVGLALLAARPAEACTAPACNESWAAPPAGETIPANAPAIVFQQGTAPITSGGAPTFAAPTLKTKDGTAIPFTIAGNLLKPSAPLPVGEVVLGYEEGCVFPAPDAGFTPKTHAFQVGAAAALPTSAGTLLVTHARRTIDVVSYSGSCTGPLDAAVADLAIALSPELVAYRPLARFVTKVDGAPWASSVFGRPGPTPSTPAYGMAAGARRPDVVFAACGAADGGIGTPDDRGLALGKHRVSIVAEVAGGPALPALEADIELSCSAVPSDGGVPADGGVPSDSGLAPADGSAGGSGCSVALAPRTAPSRGSGLGGIFGLLLVLRAALDRPRGRR